MVSKPSEKEIDFSLAVSCKYYCPIWRNGIVAPQFQKQIVFQANAKENLT